MEKCRYFDLYNPTAGEWTEWAKYVLDQLTPSEITGTESYNLSGIDWTFENFTKKYEYGKDIQIPFKIVQAHPDTHSNIDEAIIRYLREFGSQDLTVNIVDSVFDRERLEQIFLNNNGVSYDDLNEEIIRDILHKRVAAAVSEEEQARLEQFSVEANGSKPREVDNEPLDIVLEALVDSFADENIEKGTKIEEFRQSVNKFITVGSAHQIVEYATTYEPTERPTVEFCMPESLLVDDSKFGVSSNDLVRLTVFAIRDWMHGNEMRINCPHDVENGSDYCVFHRPKGAKSAEEIRSALFSRLKSRSGQKGETKDEEEENRTYLGGAQIERLELRNAELDVEGSNRPIRLTHANIDELILEEMEVAQGLELLGATIGRVKIERTTIHERLSFEKANITGKISDNTNSDASTTLAHVNVVGGEVSFEGAIFEVERETSFEGCTFGGRHIIFDDAEFHGKVNLNRVKLQSQTISFEDITFNKRVEFASAIFRGANASFNSAKFLKGVNFRHATFRDFQAEFRGAEFYGETTFRCADFKRSATFKNAQFCDDSRNNFKQTSYSGRKATFEKTRFEGPVYFDDARFEEGTTFESAKFGHGLPEREPAKAETGLPEERGADSERDTEDEEDEDAYKFFFRRVSFQGQRANFEGIEYGSGVTFESSRFETQTNFEDAQFGGRTSFKDTDFQQGTVTFRRATFEEETEFEHSRFDTRVDCGDIEFKGKVQFKYCQFGRGPVCFNNTDFYGPVNFEYTEFLASEVQFRKTSFNTGSGDVVKFNRGRFDSKEVEFEETEFRNCDVEFSNTSFDDGEIQFADTKFLDRRVQHQTEQTVTFSNIEVDGATLEFMGVRSVDNVVIPSQKGEKFIEHRLPERRIYENAQNHGAVRLPDLQPRNDVPPSGVEILVVEEANYTLDELQELVDEDGYEIQQLSEVIKNADSEFQQLRSTLETVDNEVQQFLWPSSRPLLDTLEEADDGVQRVFDAFDMSDLLDVFDETADEHQLKEKIAEIADGQHFDDVDAEQLYADLETIREVLNDLALSPERTKMLFDLLEKTRKAIDAIEYDIEVRQKDAIDKSQKILETINRIHPTPDALIKRRRDQDSPVEQTEQQVFSMLLSGEWYTDVLPVREILNDYPDELADDELRRDTIPNYFLERDWFKRQSMASPRVECNPENVPETTELEAALKLVDADKRSKIAGDEISGEDLERLRERNLIRDEDKQSDQPIDMEGALIRSGQFVQPGAKNKKSADNQSGTSMPDGGTHGEMNQLNTFYNMKGAVIGDVDLVARDEQKVFDMFLFDRTTFDGFDFSKHREELIEDDWTIHQTERMQNETGEQRDDSSRSLVTRIRPSRDFVEQGLVRPITRLVTRRRDEPKNKQKNDREWDPETLEKTYLKAKNGATQVGANRTAAQFFQKEFKYRREAHHRNARESDGFWTKLGHLYNWSANFLMWLTSGYGERPRRAVGISAILIVAFAFLFQGAWFIETTFFGGTRPVAYQGLPGSFILSAESFTTLVLGGTAVEQGLIRGVGYFEGFLGAFMIALFVFTLTRSLHR